MLDRVLNIPVAGQPADTGRKLNVHKTFRRRPGRFLNVLYTFNLRPVFMGQTHNQSNLLCKLNDWFLYEMQHWVKMG